MFEIQRFKTRTKTTFDPRRYFPLVNTVMLCHAYSYVRIEILSVTSMYTPGICTRHIRSAGISARLLHIRLSEWVLPHVQWRRWSRQYSLLSAVTALQRLSNTNLSCLWNQFWSGGTGRHVCPTHMLDSSAALRAQAFKTTRAPNDPHSNHGYSITCKIPEWQLRQTKCKPWIMKYVCACEWEYFVATYRALCTFELVCVYSSPSQLQGRCLDRR